MTILTNPKVPCLVTIMNTPKEQLITSAPLSQCKLDTLIVNTIKACREISEQYPKTPVNCKLMFLPLSLCSLQTLTHCPPTLADTPYHPTDNEYIISCLQWEHDHHTIDEDMRSL